MGAWTKNKVDSSLINGGQEYAKGDDVPLDQLNAITNNSFYAVDKAEEALVKANSAFENNGTIVKINNTAVATLNFTGDPQEQINSKASVGDLNATNSNINSLNENKANKDLSNVTYPSIIAGSTTSGSGDRVVEQYLSSDGKTWYRKWASGWKECGGIGSMVGGGSGDYTDVITFPVTFNNVPTAHLNLVYSLTIWDKPFYITHLTNTNMGFYKYSTVAISWTWSACGY